MAPNVGVCARRLFFATGLIFAIGCGLTTTRLLFNSATNKWSGEFQIAQNVVVVEELAVAEMPNGIVSSGMRTDGLSVDGALSC